MKIQCFFQLSLILMTVSLVCGCGSSSTLPDELDQRSPLEKTSRLQKPSESIPAVSTNSTQVDRMTPVSNDELSHYQGRSIYRASPKFDIAYDPTVWKLVTIESTDIEYQELVHQELHQCLIRLGNIPVEAERVSQVELGEHQWRIFLLQRNPYTLVYSLPWEDIAFTVAIQIPEPYSPQIESPCLDAAEEVLATFQVLTD